MRNRYSYVAGWVTVIFVLAVFAGCRPKPAETKKQTGPVEVHAAPVVHREARRVVDSVGTLFPFDEAIISAEIEGPVEKVNVDLGDRVAQGQVMVQISDEEQRYLVAQMEAQLRQSLERLGLKEENEKVKDIRLTPEVRRAQADLTDADQRLRRVRSLVQQGIGSQQDLDEAQARFQSLQAAYDAMLNQTRNLVRDVERTRAVLDLQRKKLRDTQVRAAFAANVKERQVTVGQYVRPNTPLLTLVKIDPIRLRAEVPERMAPWIKVGQVAEVSVEAFENRKFRGKIWRISPTVDQSKRTFLVEALIDNRSEELKPGSYARVRVETDKVEKIRLIPVSAINYVFGLNKAYVVSGGVVEARDVKLGDRYGQEVEITEGLEDGEMVATSQVARLDTGVKVRLASAAGNQRVN
ncbi:MAG TPA: efflux RND transporter periplasmic adaptor subunit [Bryobacteraceae bacterium]|nr:efflux RND transporter periplasmic adaptor subunit [Bryobacteraceae bacterium]